MIQAFATMHIMTAYVLLAVFSLLIGSLLNVVIYRLPLMLQAEWSEQCHHLLQLPIAASKPVNLFFPRSFCPNCKKTVPIWHNIPVLSYCLLKGRCSECRHKIPLRYPLVEIICLILSMAAAYRFGFDVSLLFILVFIWLLIALFVIDFQHQLLPDSLTLSILWLGLIANTQALFTSLPNAVLSTVGAYLFIWLFIKLFYLLTGKIGMGNGDFKLFAAFGAWFGWVQLPFILFISSIIGTIVGIAYLKLTHQSKDTPIPFGPFLCIAGLISLFYGPDIVHWYTGIVIR